MVVVTNILVLAYVWTAAVAIPFLQQECVTKQIGNLIGDPIQLEKTSLVPHVADWQVLIPDVPQCPDGLLGVEALVCDDVKLTVDFLSLNIIKIHRTGSLEGYGTVTPTVYCLQNSQLWSKNLPWQTNNNVAHLYAQPLSLSSSLPSLGLASQPLLGQLSKNLWSFPQSACCQSSQPALTVTPLSQDQSSFGLSSQSALPSLSVIPVSQGQSSFGLSPRSLSDLSHSLSGLSHQSVQPSLTVIPLSHSQSSLGPPSPLGQSQYRQSAFILPSQSSLPFLGQSSHQLLGQSPLLLGQHSHQLVGQAYKRFDK